MLSVNLATILLAATTVVNAVPVSNVPSLYESGIVSNAPTVLNSTAWHKDHILQPHEVILYGENRMEVLHVDAYKALLASKQLFHIDSDVQDALKYTVPPVEAASSEVETATNGTKSLADKRATCPSYTNTVTDTTQHFIGWDVQMSQVLSAVGERTTITVTSSYTLTNGITVGVSGDWTIVKDALKAAFKVDYTRSWSSSYSSAIMGTITEGYTGTMVCNPVTTRRYGRVLKGCIGAQTTSSNFMADSYEEGSHAGLTWVAGVISLCQKKVAGSLTFCEGSGTFK